MGSGLRGYNSGGGDAFLNFVHYDTRTPDWGLRPTPTMVLSRSLMPVPRGFKLKLTANLRTCRSARPSHHQFWRGAQFHTAHSDRTVGAIVHRVLCQRSNDAVRHSIVYFANPNLDGMLWQFNANGEEKGSSS
ncbi:MAG: hypothetical protein CM15mP74_27530 [Halieaceae bacterium]|nr:MAG: hypothetical protein CM15mP74_27530 [Halieaceae bacterium]